MQLVFVQDAILNINLIADWEYIWQRKQLQIHHNKKRENMRQNNHQYKVGENIIVKSKKNSKHELEFMGPFLITQINNNGTVRFQKVIINDATNVRRINHSLTKHINNKKSFHNTSCFSFNISHKQSFHNTVVSL